MVVSTNYPALFGTDQTGILYFVPSVSNLSCAMAHLVREVELVEPKFQSLV